MFIPRPQTKSRIILFEEVELDRAELHNREQRNAHYNLSVTEMKSLYSRNRSTDYNSLRSQKSSGVQDN